MDVKSIEKEVNEKGLKGKRITEEDIHNAIVGTEYYIFPNSQMTVCCLTLKNGFNATGQSACVDPANFNKELGEKIAKGKAINVVWQLEAYLLQQRIFEAE